MKWKDYNVGTKLGIGYGLIIFILILLGGVAIFQLQSIISNSNKLATHSLPELVIAEKLERGVILSNNALNDFALSQDVKYLEIAKTNIDLMKSAFEEAENKASEDNEDSRFSISVKETSSLLVTFEQSQKK